MSTPTHTPGPWRVEGHEVWSEGSNSRMICDFKKVSRYPSNYVANAAFIVRACNAHEELLGLLKHIIYEADHPDNQTDKELVNQIDWEGIRTAIAKAEGRAV